MGCRQCTKLLPSSVSKGGTVLPIKEDDTVRLPEGCGIMSEDTRFTLVLASGAVVFGTRLVELDCHVEGSSLVFYGRNLRP